MTAFSKAAAARIMGVSVDRLSPPNLRDPRFDPQPGDVLAKDGADIIERIVYQRDGIHVWYSTKRRDVRTLISNWQKWARDTQVIKKTQKA